MARKPARLGSKIAKKGAYTDVRNRILQSALTTQAKILTYLLSFVRIFAFVGFIDSLPPLSGRFLMYRNVGGLFLYPPTFL